MGARFDLVFLEAKEQLGKAFGRAPALADAVTSSAQAAVTAGKLKPEL